MEVLRKLGFKDIDDFKYQWAQDTDEVQEIKDLLLELSVGELRPKEISIRSKNQLLEFLRVQIGRENKEKFEVFFLNAKNEVLGSKIMFSGTVDRASVYPRLILEEAFKYPTRSIVLAHNHPSGDSKPSQADISLTENMQSCFKTLDIRILDHVIISKHDYFSFLEEGIM